MADYHYDPDHWVLISVKNPESLNFFISGKQAVAWLSAEHDRDPANSWKQKNIPIYLCRKVKQRQTIGFLKITHLSSVCLKPFSSFNSWMSNLFYCIDVIQFVQSCPFYNQQSIDPKIQSEHYKYSNSISMIFLFIT